jgi:hypothetical protein
MVVKWVVWGRETGVGLAIAVATVLLILDEMLCRWKVKVPRANAKRLTILRRRQDKCRAKHHHINITRVSRNLTISQDLWDVLHGSIACVLSSSNIRYVLELPKKINRGRSIQQLPSQAIVRRAT